MGFAIGIDLGTANTRIAVHRHDKFEMIPHEGQTLMPSYVAFTDTGRLVGQAAKNQASINPKNTIFSVLRFFGTKFNSPSLTAMAKWLPFEVTHDGAFPEEKQKPVFRVTHKGIPTTFTPVEILAMILGRAKKDAETYLGHPVHNAVITLPSYVDLSQRFAIKDAAEIAGLNLLRAIHASTVALTDWMVTQKISEERNVMICDLGAGFFNVVIANLEMGIQDIRAISWDDSCAGEDYDRRMMNHMMQLFNRKYKAEYGPGGSHASYGLASNPRALRRLRSACEKAKHQLSAADISTMDIEQLHGNKDFEMTITRARFEELIQDLVRSLGDPIDRALRDAKLTKDEINDVVLIGGSSRVPKVQKYILDYFAGKEPSRSLNLEETSARGAAFQAAILSGDTTSKITSEVILLDATSRSLGIETAGGVMTALIKRGTNIPTKKTEVFSTFQDNQEFFLVTCYEGERARVKDCLELGHTQVPVPPAPRGVPVLEVSITVDGNYGIVISVTEKSTGQQSSVVLNGQNARSFDRISKERLVGLTLDEEKMVADDNLEEARIEARNAAEIFIYSIKTWTESVPEERRVEGVTRLENLADIILNWMDENQTAAIWEYETRIDQLQTLKAEIATAQYQWEAALNAAKEPATDAARAAAGAPERQSLHEKTKTERNDAEDLATTDRIMQVTKKDGTTHLKHTKVEDVPNESKLEDLASHLPFKSVPRAPPTPISESQRSSTSTVHRVEKFNNQKDADKSSMNKHPVSDFSTSLRQDSASNVSQREAGVEESPANANASLPPSAASHRSSTATPNAAIEKEGPALERSDTPRTAQRGMSSLFSKSSDSEQTYTDTEFIQISTYLRNTGQPDWSKIPRLYTILRLIDQLDMLDVFIQQGITDIWFPFAQTTLPRALSPSARANFLKQQQVVLSKSLLFEKSPGRKHARFLQGEPLPYEVVAKLGAGAHGQVDKVMSMVSHREYARKLFRRVRGMSKDAINSFLIELQVLKRVQHYHCIELVQSYTDPKYFALIMSPVGDCNLLEYYSLALNDADKSSLLRSFFGCLANALQYIHSIKIRHRDIKPHNILVRGDRVFLTDFGIALDWEELSRSTTTADSGKTWVYAAPEVAKYEKRNTAADVWSLGCVFLEMATILKGQPISVMRKFFEEESGNYRFYANISRLTTWADSCRQLGSDKDDVVFDWVMLMLEEEPEKRPTAATLHHDISIECAKQGVAFSGGCCLEAVESSGIEDEDDDEAWDVGGEEMTLIPGKVPEMA